MIEEKYLSEFEWKGQVYARLEVSYPTKMGIDPFIRVKKLDGASRAPFTYQRTFDAIGAAVTIEPGGRAIGLSVAKFIAAFGLEGIVDLKAMTDEQKEEFANGILTEVANERRIKVHSPLFDLAHLPGCSIWKTRHTMHPTCDCGAKE